MNYQNFKKIIILPSESYSLKKILIYVFIAYLFGFIFRLFLAYDITIFHPEYFFQDHIIPIWASDAGLYGYYAKLLIQGKTLPYDNIHMLGHILYWIHFITGLSIDTVVFYTPAILAPLISIPIILISVLYKNISIGFFTALLSSIGFNYYYRTHLGYTDTDILIYTSTLFFIYSIIGIAETKKIPFIFIGVFSILFLMYTYHSWKPLVSGLIFSYFLYTIIFDKKTYQHYITLLFFLITILPILFIKKIILLLFFIFLYSYILKKKPYWFSYPYPFYLTLGILFTSIIFLGINKSFYIRMYEYFNKVETYYIKDIVGNIFQFSGMLQDILEAKAVPFLKSIEYIIGSPFLFIFSIIGILLFILNYRSFLLLVPLLFLGLFSHMLGIRFSTFAVPIVFFGLTSLIFIFIYQLQIKYFNIYFISILKYILMISLILYTSFMSLKYHKVITPKYTSDQAEALYNLSLQASPNDYIISFWDNGWPLWYASGLKTLTHNGKHGVDSFIIAKILTSSNSYFVANMSRFFLEKYDNFYDQGSIFRRISKEQNMTKLLHLLERRNIKLPKKTFDIYYYLNDQTILKLPTIKKYAQMSEDKILTFTFLSKRPYKIQNKIIGANFTVDTKNGFILNKKNKKVQIGNLIIANGTTYKYKKFSHKPDPNLNVIVYKNRYMFILNNVFVRSFAIRNFLLNKYDKNLFKLISITENSKILKLK